MPPRSPQPAGMDLAELLASVPAKAGVTFGGVPERPARSLP